MISMKTQPYSIKSAVIQKSFTIFSSPHSGSFYDETFEGNADLELVDLRSSEDAFVDELFSDVNSYGSQLLSAVAPRSFVDLNRSFDELDPKLIIGVKKGKETNKVKSGLGVVPRVVAKDKSINSEMITLDEAKERLNSYYFPYHESLKKMVNETKQQFGSALLIDCHSMPKSAVKGLERFKYKSPDIVLGDCFGSSCSKEILERVENVIKAHGFNVIRNYPFSGGYITKHYGRPDLNQHALQIEINRSLYMNEKKIIKNNDFNEFKEKIRAISIDLIQIGYQSDCLAAE